MKDAPRLEDKVGTSNYFLRCPFSGKKGYECPKGEMEQRSYSGERMGNSEEYFCRKYK